MRDYTELELRLLRRERRFSWFLFYPGVMLLSAGLMAVFAYLIHASGFDWPQAIVLAIMVAFLIMQWGSYSVEREMNIFDDDD